MSYNELLEWIDYKNENPDMKNIVEIQLANLSYVVASFGGSKKIKMSDFMISGKSKAPVSKKDNENAIKMTFKGLANG